jgi:predicted PurR-regulated permease PerM
VILLAVFGWMWATWGLFGALIALFAFVLAAAWAYDRRERHRRDLAA